MNRVEISVHSVLAFSLDNPRMLRRCYDRVTTGCRLHMDILQRAYDDEQQALDESPVSELPVAPRSLWGPE